jgi:hypothetical protein
LIYHPDSVFSQDSFSTRLELIQNEYYENFDVEEHKELIDLFRSKLLTRKQRSLQVWANKLDERDEFLNSLEYSKENMDLIETLLKNNKSIQESYAAAEKAAQKESEEITYGNVIESVSDQHKI